VYSETGGLTWSKPLEGYYSEAAVRLANGDLLLLPMYLRLKSDAWAEESAYLWTTSREYRQADKPVEVIGWPRKITLLPADLGNPKPEWKIASFVFNGQTLLAQDGKTYLATLYGRFAGTRRYSLVLAESVNGFQWKIRSVIADETCRLQGKEGPCESALVRLKDGRLLCVYRLDSGIPYGHSFSHDDGKTWTEPKNLEGIHSVQPSLDMSEDGMLLLSGGRPGLFLWLNRAGDVRRWDRLDLQAHHNQWAKTDPITKAQLPSDSNTSSYTEVRWLDRRSFVVIYDRLANGWRAIPPDSTATNSIWLVHGTIG
ncbi:MAG: glycoside hydrolase, partial [Gemmataceae bacterium]|nr:glycoside hydrolase [Gemmataceae bacterium]